MNIAIEILDEICKQYGESFYLLDTRQFEDNFEELQIAFRNIYPKTYIAYSYKTNYTPGLCKIIDQHGGFAEVVSDMEYKLAQKIGVAPQKIIFNGPYKKKVTVEKLLLEGGTVNLDSEYEIAIIKEIAEKFPYKQLSIGVRCNFNINDMVVSRFGFDVDSKGFVNALSELRDIRNVTLNGLHCHYPARNLDSFLVRTEKMLELAHKHFSDPPAFISIGGGLFGKMSPSLANQFHTKIPGYSDYAAAVAVRFKEYYGHLEAFKQPKLIIEPGSAIVGDVLKFAVKVINIKDIRGKKIATVSGSVFNINPTLNNKNLPIRIYNSKNNIQKFYDNLDFAGYTCIESDYLYRGYSGKLAAGDYVVFDNAGSYSIVLKPPFILPNFPILEYKDDFKISELVKREETFEDLFQSFEF